MAHQLRSSLRFGGWVLVVVLIASCGRQPEAATTPSTTDATVTTVAPTTTTSAATSTTLKPEPPPPDPRAELVVAFVSEFAAAIDSGDSEFVLARLHPEIVAAHDEGACEDYVLDEIMILVGLRLETAPEGPETRTLSIGESEITLDTYAALLVHQLDDEEVGEMVGVYTVGDDGLVYWLARCE